MLTRDLELRIALKLIFFLFIPKRKRGREVGICGERNLQCRSFVY
jgi:hypothetical protein